MLLNSVQKHYKEWLRRSNKPLERNDKRKKNRYMFYKNEVETRLRKMTDEKIKIKKYEKSDVSVLYTL